MQTIAAQRIGAIKHMLPESRKYGSDTPVLDDDLWVGIGVGPAKVTEIQNQLACFAETD